MNKYRIGNIVDLDDVAISPAAHDKWLSVVALRASALPQHVRAGDIPNEQGLWLASGELEIFVEVADSRVSMRIPPDQWIWADKKRN